MKRYITAILRNQFDLFFRFGFIDVNTRLCFDFSNRQDSSILEIFSIITPYYDESHYLLIEFEVADFDIAQGIYPIQIEQLNKIYPISRKAFVSINQSRLDSRIRIEQPLCEHLLFDIEMIFRKRMLFKSIQALWTICGLKGDFDQTLAALGTENILQGISYRKMGIAAQTAKQENYWSLLVAYDSYNLNFPSSTLGSFYDAGEVFAYSKGDETFVGSRYYNFLENLRTKDPEISLKDIVSAIEASNEIAGYKNLSSFDDLKAYLIAPVFLILKNDLRKESDIRKSKLAKMDYLEKTIGDSIKPVVVLLSSFFGYDRFYDDYYDNLNLRFFNTYKESKRLLPEQISDTQEKEEPENIPIQTEENKIATLGTGDKTDYDTPLTIGDNKENVVAVSEPALVFNSEDSVLKEANNIEQIPDPSLANQTLELNTLKVGLSSDDTEFVKVIMSLLQANKGEAKLSDIVKEVKNQTGKKTTNTQLKVIIEKLDDVDYTKGKNNVDIAQIISHKKIR